MAGEDVEKVKAAKHIVNIIQGAIRLATQLAEFEELDPPAIDVSYDSDAVQFKFEERGTGHIYIIELKISDFKVIERDG